MTRRDEEADRRSAPLTIEWHRGPRDGIRELFELAEESPQELDAYLDLGRVLVVLGEGGEPIAHLQLADDDGPGSAVIVNLAVRDGHRLLGIGRRLVEHALEVCRSEGVRRVTVMTAAADIGNLRFYQRCGFRPAGVERDAYSPEKGYPPGLQADGIPVRDAIRFSVDL